MAFVGQVGAGDADAPSSSCTAEGGLVRSLPRAAALPVASAAGSTRSNPPTPTPSWSSSAPRSTRPGREGVFLASRRSLSVFVGTGDAAPGGAVPVVRVAVARRLDRGVPRAPDRGAGVARSLPGSAPMPSPPAMPRAAGRHAGHARRRLPARRHGGGVRVLRPEPQRPAGGRGRPRRGERAVGAPARRRRQRDRSLTASPATSNTT